MPYVETFGGTSLVGVLGEDNENEGASWQVWFKDGSPDGDGRCLFYSGAIDKKGSMFTGKIHITGNDPRLLVLVLEYPHVSGRGNRGRGQRRHRLQAGRRDSYEPWR